MFSKSPNEDPKIFSLVDSLDVYKQENLLVNLITIIMSNNKDQLMGARQYLQELLAKPRK